jgi:hypothetical protein
MASFFYLNQLSFSWHIFHSSHLAPAGCFSSNIVSTCHSLGVLDPHCSSSFLPLIKPNYLSAAVSITVPVRLTASSWMPKVISLGVKYGNVWADTVTQPCWPKTNSISWQHHWDLSEGNFLTPQPPNICIRNLGSLVSKATLVMALDQNREALNDLWDKPASLLYRCVLILVSI